MSQAAASYSTNRRGCAAAVPRRERDDDAGDPANALHCAGRHAGKRHRPHCQADGDPGVSQVLRADGDPVAASKAQRSYELQPGHVDPHKACKSSIMAEVHSDAIFILLTGSMPASVRTRYQHIITTIGDYLPTQITTTGCAGAMDVRVKLHVSTLKEFPVLRDIHEAYISKGDAALTIVPLYPKGPFWAVLLVLMLKMVGDCGQACSSRSPRGNLLEALQVADYLGCDDVVEYCWDELQSLVQSIFADTLDMLNAMSKESVDGMRHAHMCAEKRSLVQAAQHVPGEIVGDMLTNCLPQHKILMLPQPLVDKWVQAELASQRCMSLEPCLSVMDWHTLTSAAVRHPLHATNIALSSKCLDFVAWFPFGRSLLLSCPCLEALWLHMRIPAIRRNLLVELLSSAPPTLTDIVFGEACFKDWTQSSLQNLMFSMHSLLVSVRMVSVEGGCVDVSQGMLQLRGVGGMNVSTSNRPMFVHVDPELSASYNTN